MIRFLRIIFLFFCAASVWCSESDTTATVNQMELSPLHGKDYATIRLRYPGVYRITFEELLKEQVPIDTVMNTLQLRSNGQTVPLYIQHKNAQTTSSENYIEFVGDLPRGNITVRMPGNQENVYYLTWGQPLPEKANFVQKQHYGAAGSTTVTVRCREQLEKDLYLSYTSLPPEVSDHYYWIKQSSATPGMYPLHLSFPHISPLGEAPQITLSLVGLNDNRTTKPGHLFNVTLGKESLGSFSFDGMTRYDWTTTVPFSCAKSNNTLLIQAPEWRKNIPDMIALDYITQIWSRTLDIAHQQLTKLTDDVITTTGESKPSTICLYNLPDNARVYCPDRGSIYLPDISNRSQASIDLEDTTATFYIVGDKGWSKVDSVKFCPASKEIADIPFDTECLVIYHPDTAKAAKFYTDYRNSQGLKTGKYDITRIFDTLNNGYISDVSLKNWLRFAFEKAPNLKYIALLGDSTNDYREIHYEEREQGEEPHLTNNKVLIPIHWVRNPATRHSAGYPDDNWYGAFHWSNMPDVTVGRIPVNNDLEAMTYLRKVVEYEEEKRTASDKLLLISSVENEFQDLVREAGKLLKDHFTTSVEMFSEADMGNICNEINSGTQLVYYLGHGGSFVWRFGPVDFQLQKDLFTPAHVHKLTNRGRYPVIVCSSCYVTSFDNRESLGESFLTAPERGAVCVIGTPWKTSVYDSHHFNIELLTAYREKTFPRLGDIFLQAKKATRPISKTFINYQTYTILGDPALRLVRTGDSKTTDTPNFPILPAEKMTTNVELLRLPATEFDVRVYRNRALLTTNTMTRKMIEIPSDATHLMIVGRGNFEAGSFPKLNVQLLMQATDGTTRTVTILKEFANSLAPAAYMGAIPKSWCGHPVRISVTVENPTFLYDERVFRLAYVSFFKESEN